MLPTLFRNNRPCNHVASNDDEDDRCEEVVQVRNIFLKKTQKLMIQNLTKYLYTYGHKMVAGISFDINPNNDKHILPTTIDG